METAQISSLMAIAMSGSMRMASPTASVSTNGETAAATQASSHAGSSTALASGRRGRPMRLAVKGATRMRACIPTIRRMDKASSSGPQATGTRGATRMMKGMAMERCSGWMKVPTWASGIKVFSTA